MTSTLAMAAIGAMLVTAVVALWMLSQGEFVVAGTFMVLFAFSMYLWETNR